MKLKLLFVIILFECVNSFAQIKTVNYAQTEIEVPKNYSAESEYEVKSDNFSAQWIYLSGEMFSNNMQLDILKQFEGQLKPDEISEVKFLSNGAKFTGKKLMLKKSELKYRIIAYGIVNKQPLVLNLGFKNEPIQNSDFDDFIIKFIRFE
ncbi:hypothetical protein [Flavobacterium sp.]|uniref:hypothetical protein n=1 Tax=Flavobacterium sp. TaxID=239 RepID=UPI003BC03BC0